MCTTKRLLLGAVVVTLSLFHSVSGVFAGDEETYFVATAYYSPLPDQSRYTTGTYAWDIRLNGSWVITASGKWVFQWLLAGPKNYPFGTKIYFEWYGIWEIADRWGAIVNAWERGHSYDRIDIWMGYWDEWLERALKWWTRTIKWKIVVPSSQVSLKLWESPLWYFDTLRVHPNSWATEVKQLQEIFTKADLYEGEIDGDYQSIRNELIEFQFKNTIISGYADEAAWYFGPKTIAVLRKKYSWDTPILVSEPIEAFAQYNHKHASKIYKTILEYWDLQVNPDSDSEIISQLQELLKSLWEYKGSIDGKYSSIEKPLIDFQKKIGLIENSDDWGAGYFGNKTKIALWNYYETQEIENQQEDITLTQTQKNQIDSALEIIRKRLKNQELRGGKKVDIYLEELSKQIDLTLPRIEDPEIKAKLKYLSEII